MSRSYRIAAVVASGSATVALLFACPAWAVSMTTSPFPGPDLFSGLVHCLAVNVGDRPSELTYMALTNSNGSAIAEVGPVTVDPGDLVRTADRDLSMTDPSGCTFRFKGKFKGSLVYRNGTEVEIIPASK